MAQPQLIYPYVLDGATGLVDAAYTRYTDFANQAWNLAVHAVDDLGSYSIPTLGFTASFDPQIALAGVQLPTAPTAPTIAFNAPPAPGDAPSSPSVNVSLSPAPTDNTVAPVYSAPQRPTLIALSDPGDAPTLNDVALPSAPTYTLPTPPSDIAINLPTPPTINLPTFTSTRPVFDAPIPAENFSFTPEEYVSALLDKTRTAVSSMLDGQFLPAAVAKALRDRATLEADNDSSRVVEDAYDQFAARGFEEPNGVLNDRIQRVRMDAASKRAGVNRDIYIQDQQVALENLRFAVTSGIQLEGQLLQAHLQMQQLSLQAAKYAVDIAISILNARIGVFNAQVQAYQIDASVFRDLIQAETAKLELYKTELEGEQVKMQLNEAQIRKYEAQLRGVNTLIEVYKSQLEAVTSQIQINAQKLEQYRTRVSVLSEQVRAQATQYEGYSAAVNAETAKARFYEAATSGYAARVNAWGTAERTKIENARLSLDNTRMQQDNWRSKLALYTAQLQTEQARIDVLVKKYGADADAYKSKVQAASVASEANNRAFQLNLAQEQAQVDTEFKRAELELKQLDFVVAQQLEIKKAIAQVSAQLSASAMSAVNFHAGTNYSGSMSLGYNLGVNFSGAVDDGTTI